MTLKFGRKGLLWKEKFEANCSVQGVAIFPYISSDGQATREAVLHTIKEGDGRKFCMIFQKNEKNAKKPQNVTLKSRKKYLIGIDIWK